ncbi:MAG TPA: hypothetical protein VMB71_10275 [Acetobacteraceae bacterium]|nr:hypothetical protein [Acetobacteraceae bacterium]
MFAGDAHEEENELPSVFDLRSKQWTHAWALVANDGGWLADFAPGETGELLYLYEPTRQWRSPAQRRVNQEPLIIAATSDVFILYDEDIADEVRFNSLQDLLLDLCALPAPLLARVNALAAAKSVLAAA